MTLDEAIKKTEEQCDHFQKMSGYFLNKDQEMYVFFTKEYKEAAVLAKWLRELKKRREQQSKDAVDREAVIKEEKPVKIGMEENNDAER